MGITEGYGGCVRVVEAVHREGSRAWALEQSIKGTSRSQRVRREPEISDNRPHHLPFLLAGVTVHHSCYPELPTNLTR